jgi:hypothetical protein
LETHTHTHIARERESEREREKHADEVAHTSVSEQRDRHPHLQRF